ncbi:acid phosphatase/Vanadium-dependent haloperoxidase [Pluteus cervinus]|uniref:Acid phosphatase/Vanadium-dependent haloperoxidase n=1 Tax=Pluteus cervinus TaxID=181527 RepID=A0ACD3B2J6_9AGAR|nr:acid phosphatase/Vanadium-dependent haloperoxidase [Pluteus cervinus]
MATSYSRIPSPPFAQPPMQTSPSRPMKQPFLFKPSHSIRDKPPVTRERRQKLFRSYAPDWILTIGLALCFFLLDKVNGYRREFSVSDTSLRHTFAVHERVPDVALYMICFVSPLLIQPVINFCTVRSWWDFHNGTLGLILGLSLTGAVTQIVKITVGRPRPDLIDRCQPPIGTVDPEFGLSNWTICTRLDLLNDGFRSFPSGHSSLSFAGLGFLSYYLAGKLHLFDRRGQAHKAWLSLGPFAAAALVAVSRTMDYRHHWQDVLTGSILGTVTSYFAYRQYYPSLADERSHRPYSPRIKRDEFHDIPMHYQPASGTSSPRHSDQEANGNDQMTVVPEGTVPRPEIESPWKARSGGPGDDNLSSSEVPKELA